MDEEKFTNRHGHTVAAVKEAVSTLPEPEHVANPKPVRRRKKRIFRFRKIHFYILLVLATIIIFVPIGVGEYVKGTYDNNVSDAKSKVAQLFYSVTLAQKNPTTSKSLAAVDTQLASIRDNMCPGEFYDNIAKLYPRAKEAYDKCAAYKTSVTALDDLVGSASEQMTYLERLQPLLQGVSQPLEDKFAVLTAQQENWQTFVNGLKQLSVPIALNGAHANLLKQATAVHEQWIALVQASNAYDSAAFREARAKLTESYTAFQTASSEFTNVINITQASITNAVAALR